jgi:hypothetical protein
MECRQRALRAGHRPIGAAQVAVQAPEPEQLHGRRHRGRGGGGRAGRRAGVEPPHRPEGEPLLLAVVTDTEGNSFMLSQEIG